MKTDTKLRQAIRILTNFKPLHQVKLRRGQKHGDLTLVKIIRHNPKSKSYTWLCECVCGELCEVSSTSILNGTVSCGCKRKRNMRSFYIPAVCRECGEIYTTNKHKSTRGLCLRCGAKRSKREWAARNRRKKGEIIL